VNNQNSGCLGGLLKLFLLDRLFGWLQGRFGFGRGCSGCGCGVILLIIFVVLAFGVLTNTDWLRFGF
jgi:hypothetical protein